MENDDSQYVYIIDTYSKYENNEGVRNIFMINNNWYCVRACPMEWGVVQTPHIDDEFLCYHIFDTLEEASKTALQIKKTAEGKWEL